MKFVWLAVGAEADDDRIELLLSEVKGKDITELIAAGREKLSSVPSGGGAIAVAASGGGAGGAAPEAAAAESKKEEKVEEKEESDDVIFYHILYHNEQNLNCLSSLILKKLVKRSVHFANLKICLFSCRIWVSASLTKRLDWLVVCMKALLI